MNKYLLERILTLLVERGCVVIYKGVSDYIFKFSDDRYHVYNYDFTAEDIERITIAKNGDVMII